MQRAGCNQVGDLTKACHNKTERFSCVIECNLIRHRKGHIKGVTETVKMIKVQGFRFLDFFFFKFRIPEK